MMEVSLTMGNACLFRFGISVAGLTGLLVCATSFVTANAFAADVDYCAVDTHGTKVELVRPAPDTDAPIDDVNWFARPVPTKSGDWVIAFATHNQNYLYDLTNDRRVRMPDHSDAVSTPDGRYMTVPSHYTDDHTINFYDNAELLSRLRAGRDADDVAPVFAHADLDVYDVYYQSIGVVSHQTNPSGERTVYRMMFSGTRHDPAPGFRIVDYEFRASDGALTVKPSRAMALCPQIVQDMNTPFISKDGRYVVAHDNTDQERRRPSLKVFEITGVDPDRQTTTCVERIDFGFAAGKADFSFDNSRLAFHVAKNDYLTAFVNGGLARPVITDVVVVQLKTDTTGAIVGHGDMARVTTSTHEGIGNYFPAFLPDGRLFFISNSTPKDSDEAKRFTFTVVDPSRELFMSNVLADDTQRQRAAAIGRAWRDACKSTLSEFQRDEAAWYFMSLDAAQCRALVQDRWPADDPSKNELLSTCELGRGVD